MNVPTNVVTWIFNYLTSRHQYVRLLITQGTASAKSVLNVLSDTIVLNIVIPQRTLLSPSLFTLYTADGRLSDESCPFTKFADDKS